MGTTKAKMVHSFILNFFVSLFVRLVFCFIFVPISAEPPTPTPTTTPTSPTPDQTCKRIQGSEGVFVTGLNNRWHKLIYN